MSSSKTKFQQVVPIILLIVLATSIFGAIIVVSEKASATEFTYINAQLTPQNPAPIHNGESIQFTYTIYNGSYPMAIQWRLNDTLVQQDTYTKQTSFGSGNGTLPQYVTYTYTCPQATEDVYLLTAIVQTLTGAQHIEQALIIDPYNNPTQIENSANTGTYSYKLETDGLGWYRTIQIENGEIIAESTDAAAQIQSIINTKTDAKIMPGTYNLQDTTLSISDHITLTGSGENTILTTTHDTAYNQVFTIANYQAGKTGQVILENFKIQGTSAQLNGNVRAISLYLSKNVTLNNLCIDKFTYAIYGDDAAATQNQTETTIKNCYITNCYAAIFNHRSFNGHYYNNKIHNVTIGIAHSGINNQIYNNQISKIGAAAQYFGAIWVANPRNTDVNTYTSQFQIYDNTIDFEEDPNYMANGIVIDGEATVDTYVKDGIITDNQIEGTGANSNSYSGIYLHIRVSPSKFLNIENITINSNRISDVTVGINTLAGNLTITGNTITARIGISSMGTGPVEELIGYNVISANKLTGTDTTQTTSDAIRLVGSYYNVVTSNLINSFYNGIIESYPTYPNGDYNNIALNTIINTNNTITVAGIYTDSNLNYCIP